MVYREINEHGPAYVIEECGPACLDTGVDDYYPGSRRDRVVVGSNYQATFTPFMHDRNPVITEDCVLQACTEVRTREQTINDGLTARLNTGCCPAIYVPHEQEELLVGECVGVRQRGNPFYPVCRPNIVCESALPEPPCYAVGLSRNWGRTPGCMPERDENSLVCKKPEYTRCDAVQTKFTFTPGCAPESTPREVNEPELPTPNCRGPRECVPFAYYEIRDC
jgi:hypothetical protein